MQTMTQMFVVAHEGNVFIHPDLNAKVSFRPDGLYVEPMADTTEPAPTTGVSAAVLKLFSRPQDDTPVEIKAEEPPKQAELAQKPPRRPVSRQIKDRRSQANGKTVAELLEIATSGISPVDFCLTYNVKPSTLRSMLKGQGSYAPHGGSQKVFDHQFDLHPHEWAALHDNKMEISDELAARYRHRG